MPHCLRASLGCELQLCKWHYHVMHCSLCHVFKIVSSAVPVFLSPVVTAASSYTEKPTSWSLHNCGTGHSLVWWLLLLLLLNPVSDQLLPEFDQCELPLISVLVTFPACWPTSLLPCMFLTQDIVRHWTCILSRNIDDGKHFLFGTLYHNERCLWSKISLCVHFRIRCISSQIVSSCVLRTNFFSTFETLLLKLPRINMLIIPIKER